MLRLLLLTSFLVIFARGIGLAQTYSDLHDFGGGVINKSGLPGADGQNPSSGVIFDSAGNMYGTAYDGSAYGGGMVWEITAGGTYLDLHEFGGTITNADSTTGPDGRGPRGGLAIDAAGNLYGTTYYGGPNSNSGMLWEITTTGTYIDLHDFGAGTDGQSPFAGVTIDSAGNLYGTTIAGGVNRYDGMVWELTSGGVYLDKHDFGGLVANAAGPNGLDGQLPYSGVTLDAAGNMYGTAFEGGAYSGSGMIWEITAGGTYFDIHDFGGTLNLPGGGTVLDGKAPQAGVTFDAVGNMYGTASSGGAGTSFGIVWKLDKLGGYTDLHDFGALVTNANGTIGADGTSPTCLVAFDSLGNMFGTTSHGGPILNSGNLWEITASGMYVDLHDFGGQITLHNGSTGVDGQTSLAGVTVDPYGNLYGTASTGGGAGMVWKLAAAPPVLKTVTLSPNTVFCLNSTTGTVTLSGLAPAGGVSVTLSSNNVGITMPSTVLVAGGTNHATFTVNTVYVSTVVTAKVAATYGGTTIKTGITVDPAPILANVVLAPSTVFGTGSTTGTVTLNEPALTGGVTVYLSSNNVGITVPASVIVPSGSTTATFPVNTVYVTTIVTAKITGTLDHVNLVRAPITVDPMPALANVALAPNTVFGTGSTTGTVTLNETALSGGVTVYLSSNNVGITVPASVTVPEGSISTTFPVNTVYVTTVVTAKITGTLDHVNLVRAPITVDPLPVLTGVTLSPATVTGGVSTTGTVTINEPALSGGVVVYLSSNNTGITVNSAVTIPEGSTSATFTVNTIPEGSVVTAKITATIDNVNLLRTGITVNPPSLQSVTLPQSSVQGSSATIVRGNVTLNGLTAAGTTVITLTSSDPSVTVPATVTVFEGSASATFLVGHSAVATATTVTITASLGGVTQTTTITVNP